MGKKAKSKSKSKATNQLKVKLKIRPPISKPASYKSNNAQAKPATTSSNMPAAKSKAKKVSNASKLSTRADNNKIISPVKALFTKPINNQPKNSAVPVNKPNPRAASSSSSSNSSGNKSASSTNSSLVGAISKPSSDKSLMNVSHDVRINGFFSMQQIVEKATPRAKNFLLNECDLILECRLCRNLFRSLPNFISHKTNYCKSLFHPTAETGCSQFLQSSSYAAPPTAYQYYMANNSTDSASKIDEGKEFAEQGSIQPVNVGDTKSQSSSSLYNNIQELNEQIFNNTSEIESDPVKLALAPIKGQQSTSVMFQKRMGSDQSICEATNQIYDSREVMNRDTAILGPDGKVICTGTERGIEKIVRHLTAQIDLAQRKMNNDSTNQFPGQCDICKTVFTTEKAFRQHKRDTPDCIQISTKHSGNNNGSPPGKRSRLEESPSGTNSVVRQLFSKSPQKTFQRTSTVLSPYKKTIGKAVKQLQIKQTLKFPCTKCLQRFSTTAEMSLHQVNECLGCPPPKHRQPRIQIQARNSYTKKVEEDIVPIVDQRGQEKDEDLFNEASVDLNFNCQTSTKLNSKDFESNNNSKVNITNGSSSDVEMQSSVLLPDRKETSSSESDGETVSNVTDSGISSSAAAEDNSDGHMDTGSPTLSLNEFQKANGHVLSDSLRENSPVAEKIFMQTNKNLTGDSVKKRISVRNLQKTSSAGTTRKEKLNIK